MTRLRTDTSQQQQRPRSLPRPKSFITNPILFLVTWTITLILLPFIACLLTSFYIYRAIIRVMATRNPSLSTPLTPYDCIFAVDSYHTRPYASNLTVLELRSRIDLPLLRSLFQSRILDDPTFSKLYCAPIEYLGYWFWKPLEHKPDIQECVKLYHDSELELGPAKSVDDCLREIVEMPYTNELFNVMLLHFGNRSYIVFRIHHTVCDGYSFNKLIDKFVGLQSKYLVKECATQKKWIGRLNDYFAQWRKIGILLFHLPLHVSQLYRESLTHTPNFYTLRKTSKTGMIRKTVLPLSQMKHIRSASNSHFASTGMALMTGALQKFYDSTPNPPHLRPDRLSIMHSLPKPNHPLNCSNSTAKRELCNWWGVGLFKIPFTRDSVSRLFGAEDDFNEYMGLQYHNLLHIHMPIISLIPCWLVKWFFSINFGTSCGFTSVPGLFDKVAYVGGSQPGGVDLIDGGIIENSASGPVEVLHMWKVFGLQWRQSAVAVAMYTYRGEASVSLYANKGDIIPDENSMDRLLELFHQEFNELVAYSSTKPSNGTTHNHHNHQYLESKKHIPANGVIKSSSPQQQQQQQNNMLFDSKFLDAKFFRNNKLA